MYRLNKPITNIFLQLHHAFSKRELPPHGRSFKNVVASRADAFETPVSCASRLRYFLGEVPSLAPMPVNVSSVSTFRYLSAFCLASFSSNWPGDVHFVHVEVIRLETCAEILCDFCGRLMYETELH
jgi:hypothetical protein